MRMARAGGSPQHSAMLYDAQYYDCEAVYQSQSYEEYLQSKSENFVNAGLSGIAASIDESEPGAEAESADFTDYVPGEEDEDTFASYEALEPANWNAKYAAALVAQLAAFGIDDAKDTDPFRCTPVCAIRYYLGWDRVMNGS